jgi:hypothetical protein
VGMQVDESHWPLVEVRWLDVASDPELAEFLAMLDRWLARGVPFGLLLDSRGAQGLSSEQRKLVLATMKRTADLTGRHLVQAIVIDNPIQRALYFAMAWAFAMPFPSKAFGDLDAARAWLKVQVDARSQPPAAHA